LGVWDDTTIAFVRYRPHLVALAVSGSGKFRFYIWRRCDYWLEAEYTSLVLIRGWVTKLSPFPTKGLKSNSFRFL
jgi:hypothetical protein